MLEPRRVHCYHVPDEGSGRELMHPLAAAVEHDVTCLHFCAAPHRQRSGIRQKRRKGQPRWESQISYAWGIFLTPQHLKMVHLCPGKAGSKLVAGQDDGLDLCLAQARFVVIGFEERARAPPGIYRPAQSRISLWLSVDRPKDADYADSVDSEANLIAFVRLLGRRADDAVQPKAIHRIANDRQPKSDQIPRTRNRRRSR